MLFAPHCNLRDLVLGKYSSPLIDISLQEMLCQIVRGLEHLHALKVVHGDIKPTNILISYPKGALSAQMKVADFGLFHSVGSDESDSGDNQFLPAFTEGWLCPSDPVDEEGNTNSSFDIFPLGCICAFAASHGVHPFGVHLDEAIERIKTQQPLKLKLAQIDESLRTDAFFDLIKQMVSYNASDRPTSTEILSYLLTQPLSVITIQQQKEVQVPVMEPIPSTSSRGKISLTMFCPTSEERSQQLTNVGVEAQHDQPACFDCVDNTR